MRLTGPTLAAVVLLTLGSAPVLAVGSRSADAAKAEHQRIVDYWTAERMASAKPRDFVRTARGFEPAAKPPRPGGSGTTVTGASWTKGGAVAQAVGKVYF